MIHQRVPSIGVLTRTCGVLLPLLITTACARGEVFPGRLGDWVLVDSTIWTETRIPNMHGIPPELVTEYGVILVGEGHYLSGTDTIAVTLYRMLTTQGAFGLFSCTLGSEDFIGQIGNGVQESDTAYRINYGTIFALLTYRDGRKPFTLTRGEKNALHDHLIRLSDFTVVLLNLPMDERKLGSERFFVGPRSWTHFKDSAFERLLPILQIWNAYIIDYRKERLPFRRRMIYFSTSAGEAAQSLAGELRRALQERRRKGRAERAVEEYPGPEDTMYLVSGKGGVYLVRSAQDDPGAFEWLTGVFGG